MISVLCINRSNTESLKVTVWPRPGLQQILHSDKTPLNSNETYKSFVHFQCIGIYYGDESNSSGMVEDEPYITDSNQATCAHGHEGKRRAPREQKPKTLLKLSLHARGARARLSSWTRLSFNDQSYTNPPSLKTGFCDRNTYTAVRATSQMFCCL